jgi:enoyl-CoA hydratase/carnithine racemase
MSALSLHIADTIATITFDQPGSKVNVLTRAACSEWEALLVDLAKRTDLHGLIIESAKPGIFIAGADLKEFTDVPSPDHPPTRQYIELGLHICELLEALPFPTAACIDGAALGGGLELALACDYRLAGTNPKTRLGLPEVSLGLIPGWGGTQRLPRLIGVEPALEVIVGNAQLDAESARSRGLVAAVVQSESLRSEATRVLAGGDWRGRREQKQQSLKAVESTLTKNNSPAAVAAKEVVAKGATLPIKEAIPLETAAFMQLVASPEARRQIGEFFNRKK